MKKIIAMLLVLTLALGLFAGCNNEEPVGTTAAAGSVEDAKAYLAAMYKDNEGAVLRDFERVAVVAIDGVKYSVTWTVDVAEDLVKITSTDTMATIDINEKPAEDFTFVLTATLADAEGKTATVSFTHSVAAPASTGTLFVENPEVGVPYKWALQQNGIDGQPVLYFTGEKSGNYLATSENPLDAVDVIIEATEGGYHLTFMEGETKKYINITTYTKDDGSLSKTQDIGDEPTCVYTWDAERGTMIAFVEALGESFYLGTYNTYNTISASATSYIEDVTKIGVSQFPAGFCTINAEVAETPTTGVAYVWGLQQNGLDTPATLYFTGVKDGNYLATSTNIGDAVRVYLEETEGGYHLYFLQDGAVKYINITTYTKDDGSVKNTQDIGDEPTCVYTWDAERGTMVAYIEALEASYYLGTYNTYTTISSSASSYIEDVSKIGVSQFPTVFYDLGLPVEELPDPSEQPKYPAADSELTISEALQVAADADANGEYTPDKYYITGEITEIENDKYGNCYIKDAEGNTLYIYGLYNADGTVRFDAMDPQPKVGDTVTIYTVLGAYNGSAQAKNAWVTSSGSASETPSEPVVDNTYVTAPAVGTAYKMGLYQTAKGEIYYFTGEMNGYYGATSTVKEEGVDVYLEDAGDGNFYIYFMSGETKNYIYGEASGKYLNFKFGETKSVFTWNADHGTFTTVLGETTVYMGTYDDYVTFGMSNVEYLEGSYPAHLYN